MTASLYHSGLLTRAESLRLDMDRTEKLGMDSPYCVGSIWREAQVLHLSRPTEMPPIQQVFSSYAVTVGQAKQPKWHFKICLLGSKRIEIHRNEQPIIICRGGFGVI